MIDNLVVRLARQSCKLPRMAKNQLVAGEQTCPLKVQGDALRAARRGRPVREIVSNITDPETGKTLSIGRYQHWERGMNAPRRALWDALSKQLGIDVGALYTASTTRPDAVDPSALRPIVASLKRSIELLEALIGPAASDANVVKAGFKKMNNAETMKGSGKKRRTVSA
jgi:hypothetical protein